MNKLEEKLNELGYRIINVYENRYLKELEDCFYWIRILDNQVLDGFIQIKKHIFDQEQLDNLQFAFIELQKDLEILKGV